MNRCILQPSVNVVWQVVCSETDTEAFGARVGNHIRILFLTKCCTDKQ